MKRLAAACALAFALAGSADADVFRVLPAAPTAAVALPSAEVPNGAGSIVFPDSLRTRPLSTQTLSYGKLLGLWQRAAAEYGVPWRVLAAINKVESNFGQNMGPSSAGAIGWMQFMPSTWERWGVDADGDGIADPWNAEDAITAAARYLAASGGQTDIARAVFSYNHAQWYVDEVLQLAQTVGTGGVDATFSLDRLQISLDQAQAAVVRAKRRLAAGERKARDLAGHERALRRRLAATTLLSDRFALQRRVVQAGVARAAAQAQVRDLRAAVGRSQAGVAAARDAAQIPRDVQFSGRLTPLVRNALNLIQEFQGVPYVWGGESPNGFDCSGLLQYVWGKVGVEIPRTTFEQWDAGRPVSTSDLQPGDAVFFRGSDSRNGKPGHVGMYIGGGEFIEAPHTGSNVRISNLRRREDYMGARRFTPAFLPGDAAFGWQDAGRGVSGEVASGPVFAIVPDRSAPTSGSVVLFTR